MFSVASNHSSSLTGRTGLVCLLQQRKTQELWTNNTLCFPYSIIGVNVGEKLKIECLKAHSAQETLQPKGIWWLNHPTPICLNHWARMRVTSLGTPHNEKSILKLIYLSFPCRDSVWDCSSSQMAFNRQMFLSESCSSCSLCVSKAPD